MAAPHWIEVQDSEVIQAMNRMNQAAVNPGPALRAIGEALKTQVKKSFETSTDPWGSRWVPNSQATYVSFLNKTDRERSAKRKLYYGKNARNKDDVGRLNKGSGITVAMNKKPLFGHTYDLFRQFHWNATPVSLYLYSTMKYAAMQNFGGTKAQFPNLWGDIPARPFMPVNAAGQMAPSAQAMVLEIIQEHILGKGT